MVKGAYIGDKYTSATNFCKTEDATPLNFVEKVFTNSNKTSKFVKVFSLESFPLYGALIGNIFEA